MCIFLQGGDWGDDGVLLYQPHSGGVACMAFSCAHPTHLLSCSFDGSLRCMDVEKAVFDDVSALCPCFEFIFVLLLHAFSPHSNCSASAADISLFPCCRRCMSLAMPSKRLTSCHMIARHLWLGMSSVTLPSWTDAPPGNLSSL